MLVADVASLTFELWRQGGEGRRGGLLLGISQGVQDVVMEVVWLLQ